MPHWTTFDEDSSSALRAKLPPGETVIQLTAGSPVEHVLQHGKTLVAVLPAHGLGQAGLAVFRWNQVAARVAPAPLPESIEAPPPPAASEPPSAPSPEPYSEPLPLIRATGFLGLTDAPIFDEEEEQQKKSWWKRFWEN